MVGGKKKCLTCNVSFYGTNERKYCSVHCANLNRGKPPKAVIEYIKEYCDAAY